MTVRLRRSALPCLKTGHTVIESYYKSIPKINFFKINTAWCRFDSYVRYNPYAMTSRLTERGHWASGKSLACSRHQPRSGSIPLLGHSLQSAESQCKPPLIFLFYTSVTINSCPASTRWAVTQHQQALAMETRAAVRVRCRALQIDSRYRPN